MICYSGVGLTPVIDGRLLHLSAGGLSDGLILLVDDETGTWWNHMTGKAEHGPLVGKQMEWWSVPITTVRAALDEDPNISLWRSSPGVVGRLMTMAGRFIPKKSGFLPPGFGRTMEAVDPRLPKLTRGLGVFTEHTSRFYPEDRIGVGVRDEMDERCLLVAPDPATGIPRARWEDDGSPKQVLARWYGIAASWPGCEVY